MLDMLTIVYSELQLCPLHAAELAHPSILISMHHLNQCLRAVKLCCCPEHQVNSFTVPGKPESGNPAAVVLEHGLGRVLSESERRAIAAYLDQPVTAFVAATVVASLTSATQVCTAREGLASHIAVGIAGQGCSVARRALLLSDRCIHMHLRNMRLVSFGHNP